MTFTFTAAVAYDPIGKQAVKNTSFQVYATADTGFVTPLAITDPFGVALPGNILNSGTIGVFPEFKQAANSTVVITDPTRTYVWTVASVMQDTSVSAFVNNKTSSTAGAVRAATASIWQTSTAYTAGQPVINPTGDLMRCTTAHTSTTAYDSTKFALNATDASSATSAALTATYGRVHGVTLSTTNDSTTAIANVAALNSAITSANTAGGGTVRVNNAGVFQLSGSVLMKSNVTLDIPPGVTLRKLNNAPAVCMIRNANVSDVKPYTDKYIAVIGGGKIDCNPANNLTRPGYSDPAPAAGTLHYGIVGDLTFYGVSNLMVSGVEILGGHGSCIQMMGDDLTISRIPIYTPGDGFHVNGPCKRVKFNQITGTTEDDFIALLPWDWARTGPTVGDIEDVTIDDCTYFGAGDTGPAGSAAIKMVPGTRSTGYGIGSGALRNVRVNGLNFSGGSGVQLQSEFDQIAGTHSGAGVAENIRFTGGKWGVDVTSISPLNIRKITIGGAPADGQTSLAVRNFIVDGVHFNSTTHATAPTAVGIDYSYTGLAMQGLIFRDCSWTPRTTGGGAFVNVISKTPVEGVDVDGLNVLGNMSVNACVLTVNNTSTAAITTLKRATLRRLRTAPGVTMDAPVVSLSGVLEKLFGGDWDLQHTGGAGDDHGIWFGSANALLGMATLTALIMRSAKTMLRVGNGATGSVIAKAVLTDCDLIGVTHPVFISGNRQADVTFRGGNIDTAGNLARVDGSTLTLALDGATSSGAGAAIITPVNTVTIRVPLSNKIALPLNTLTLTEQDGDYVKSTATPTGAVSGTGAGTYIYRGGAGFVKLN